jgi:hypothetical protein
MEHRKAPRHRVLKSAKISFHDNASVIDCTIRDTSDTGVRLRVETPVGIPTEFELIRPEEPSRNCRTIWRKAKEIGAQFLTRKPVS